MQFRTEQRSFNSCLASGISVASLFLHLLVLICPPLASGLTVSDLFPYGTANGDQEIFQNDDGASPIECFSVAFPFYDVTRDCLFVNTNGVISFTTSITTYTSESFPLQSNSLLLAPYWADVDTRSGGGSIFFRSFGDPALLSMANGYVHNAFISHKSFRASLLFIATWDSVGYYDRKKDKLNTFQCVLITDGQDLFVLFLYADIQWTMGDGSGGTNGTNETPAQVGFNAGDNKNFFSVPGSQTPEIINITQTSNVGVPGVWLFHASPKTITSGGCVKGEGKLKAVIFPSYGSILGGDTISIQGPCFSGPPDITMITCEVDEIQTPAVFISSIEAVCISPQLTRVGRVPFRVYLDGVLRGETEFTSMDVEEAHQVDLITPGNILAISLGTIVTLNWNPDTIFPPVDPSAYRVDIAIYELDPATDQWSNRAVLEMGTENDGEHTIRLANPPLRTPDLSPIAFHVFVNSRSLDVNAQFLRLATDRPVGRWTSQFYYIQPTVLQGTSRQPGTSRLLCRMWYLSESSQLANELGETAIACPPRREQAVMPNSGLSEVRFSSFFGNTLYQTQWLGYLHPRASSCFKQRAANISKYFAVEQECCYDSSEVLINGPPGGGSVNKYSQGFSRGGHFTDDVKPYILCCTGQTPNCPQYFERRPSDDGSRYIPQPPAWMFGDPHLVTLDGYRYTFNGQGEFTLIETVDDSFSLQGRLIRNGTNPSTGTVFSALAAKESDSVTVMIALSRRGVDVFINGSRIDLELITVQKFNGVTIFKDNDTRSAVFSSGAYIEATLENGFLSRVVVSLPRTYLNKTKGLLGVFNGAKSDDLRPRGGDLIDISSGIQDIHNLFGITWILQTESESLFTYFPYESFSGFKMESFTPVFTPDTSTVSNPDDLTLCDGNVFCIYDLTVTGSRDVALSTLSSALLVNQTELLSIPVRCSSPCMNGVCVSENTCSCNEGYTGLSCDQPVYSECSVNPCLENERCGVLAGSFNCEGNCDISNPICDLPTSGPCLVNPCLNGGVCSVNTSLFLTFTCLCLPGYSGILCGLVSTDDTPTPCPCQNGGICLYNPSNQSFNCSCPDSISGELCEQLQGLAINSQTLVILIVVVCILFVFVAITTVSLVCVCYKCRSYQINKTRNLPPGGIENTTVSSSSGILYYRNITGSDDNSGIAFPPDQTLSNKHGEYPLTIPGNSLDSNSNNGISRLPFISEQTLSSVNRLSHLPSNSEQTLDNNEKFHRLSYSRTPLQSKETLNTHNVLQTSPSPPGALSTTSLNGKTITYNNSSGKRQYDPNHPRRKSTSCLTNHQPLYINTPQHNNLSPSKSLQVDTAWYHSASSLAARQTLPPHNPGSRNSFTTSTISAITDV